ncbi:MAG: hypothetical protein ABIP51_20540 [Bacteroidia bacterium]
MDFVCLMVIYEVFDGARSFLSLFILLFTFFKCYSQDGQVVNVNESVLSTSDRTYLSFGQGLGNYKTPYGVRKLNPLVFEGQISPDFFLNLSKKKSIGIAFFPKIVVRMFHETSVPVKTPSYNPSILLYHRIKSPFAKKVFQLFTPQNQITFLTYRLIHHSNGQNGSYFIPGTDTINYVNGNFSTNAVEVGFSWSGVDSNAVGKSFMNGRIAYERQLDFERETHMKDSYYYNKVTLESHAIRSEKIKAYFTYAFMWGTKTFGTRHSFDLIFSVKPFHKLSDFSVFIRGYIGPDYYNLYYPNILRTATIGIIADPLSIPVFKRQKKKA